MKAAERTAEKGVSRDSERKEKAAETDRKERKSVLGRLNEKKEQVKSQPKKSGPRRAQEAAI